MAIKCCTNPENLILQKVNMNELHGFIIYIDTKMQVLNSFF